MFKSIYDIVIAIKKLLLHPLPIFILSSNLLILIIILYNLKEHIYGKKTGVLLGQKVAYHHC